MNEVSGEENQQRPRASSNRPPHWIICRSNTIPNRSYYFDMNSGHAVWNLQDALDLGNQQPGYSQARSVPLHVPRQLYNHHFPEPGNTPEQKETLRQRAAFTMPAFANIPTSDRNYSQKLDQPIQSIVPDYHAPIQEATATGPCRNEHRVTLEPKGTNEVAKYHKLDPRIKRNIGEDLTLNNQTSSEIFEESNYKTFVHENSNDKTISVKLADSFLRGTGQSLYQRFAAGQIQNKDFLSKESVTGKDLIAKYGNDNYENTFHYKKHEAVNPMHCFKNDKPDYTDTDTKMNLDPQYSVYEENNDLISVIDNDIYNTCNNVSETENSLTLPETNNKNSTINRIDTLHINEKNINLKNLNQIKNINTIINTKNKTLTQLTVSPIFVLPLTHSGNENLASKTYTYLYSKSKLTKQVSWIEDIHCNKPCKEALAENIISNNDMFIMKNRQKPDILNTIINDTSALSDKERNDNNDNKENTYHKYSTHHDYRKINNPRSLTSNKVTLQHGPKTDPNNMEVIVLEDLRNLAQSNSHIHTSLTTVAHQPAKYSDLNCRTYDNNWTKIELCDNYNKQIEHECAQNPYPKRQASDNFPSVQLNSNHNTTKQVEQQLSRIIDLNKESTDNWTTKQANVFANKSKQAGQSFPDNVDVNNEKPNDWLAMHANMNCDIPKHFELALSRNLDIKSESSDDCCTKQTNVYGNTKNPNSRCESYDTSFRKQFIQLPRNPKVTNDTENVNNNSLNRAENQPLKNLNVVSEAIDNWQKPKILENRVWSGNPLNLLLTPNRSPNFQIENGVENDSHIIETHYNKTPFKSHFDEENCIFVNEQIADNDGQLNKDIKFGFTQMNDGTENRNDDTLTTLTLGDATSLKRKRDLSPNDLRLVLAAKRKCKTDADVKDTENASKKFINLRNPPETSKSPKKRVSFSLQDQVHEIERLKPKVPLNVSPSWSLGEPDDHSYTEKKSPIFDTEVLRTFKVTVRNEKSESYLNGNLSSGDSPMDIDYDITDEKNTLKHSIAFSESSINDYDNRVLLLDRIGHEEIKGENNDQREFENINKISFDEYRGHIQSINNNKPAIFKCGFDTNKSDIDSSLQQEIKSLSNDLIDDEIENQLFHMNSVTHSLTETNKSIDVNNSSSAECKEPDNYMMSERRRAKSRTEKLMDKISAFEKNPTYPKKLVRTVDVAKTKSILLKLKETKTRAYETNNSDRKDCSKDLIPAETAAGNESPMKPIKTRIIDKRPFIKTDLNIKRTKREEQRIERENYYKSLFEVHSYEKSNLEGYEDESEDMNDAIQNEMMERIDDRIDEYMTHLVQLLEDVTLEVLKAKNMTTEDLCTLKDQVDCVSKMYELDAGVKAKSRKISLIMLDLFEANGKLRKITPEKFMLFYTYGLALTDTLQAIYPENKTYSDAIDNLSELFKRIETSETDKYFYDLKAASEPCHEDEKPEPSDSESIYNHTKYVDSYIDNQTPMFGVSSPSQPKRIHIEDLEKKSLVIETTLSQNIVQKREYDKIHKLEKINDNQVECMNEEQEFRNDKSQEVTDSEKEDIIEDKQIDMSKIDLRILQNIKISVKATEIQESPAIEKSEFFVDENNDVSRIAQNQSILQHIKSDTNDLQNSNEITCDINNDVSCIAHNENIPKNVKSFTKDVQNLNETACDVNNDVSRIAQNEGISKHIKVETKEVQNLNEATCDKTHNIINKVETTYHNHAIENLVNIGDTLSVTFKNTKANSELAIDVHKSDSISKTETQNSLKNADQNIKEYLDLDALDYDYDDSDNDALVVDLDCDNNVSEVATNDEKFDKDEPNSDMSETETNEQPLRETITQIIYASSPIEKGNNNLSGAAFDIEIPNEDLFTYDSEAETLKLSPTFAETVNERKTELCPTIKYKHQVFDDNFKDDVLSEDLAASNFCSDTKREKSSPVTIETVETAASNFCSDTKAEQSSPVTVETVEENISVISTTNNEENQFVFDADGDTKNSYDDYENKMDAAQEVVAKYDQGVVNCNQTNLKSNENAHPTCIVDINCKQSVNPHPTQCIQNWYDLNDTKIKELTPQAQNFTKLNNSDKINNIGIPEERVGKSERNENDDEINFKGAHVTHTNDSEFSDINEDLLTVLKALNSVVVNVSNFIDVHKFGRNANVTQALDLSLEEVKTLTNDVVYGLRSLLKNVNHPLCDVVEPLERLAPQCVLGSAGERLGLLFANYRSSIAPVMKKIIASKKRLYNIPVGTKNVIVLRNGKMIK